MTVPAEPFFVLGPSPIHGVGVFAVRAIVAGTELPLFSEGEEIVEVRGDSPIRRKYCVQDGADPTLFYCPNDFQRMSVGWYMNHSDDPNAGHDGDFVYRALRDIAADEEILIDYRTLGEHDVFSGQSPIPRR
jgi:SET domain-containing protein